MRLNNQRAGSLEAMHHWDYVSRGGTSAECQLQHVVNRLGIWVIGNLNNRMLRQLNIGRMRPNLPVPCSVPRTTR